MSLVSLKVACRSACLRTAGSGSPAYPLRAGFAPGRTLRMRRPIFCMSCARVGMSSSFFTAATSMYCPCRTPPAQQQHQLSLRLSY